MTKKIEGEKHLNSTKIPEHYETIYVCMLCGDSSVNWQRDPTSGKRVHIPRCGGEVDQRTKLVPEHYETVQETW